MANEILKLKEIGAYEISRKTRIPIEYVEYFLDGNFAELSKLNAKAYIKIISREFDVDLSEYLASFESFCADNANSVNKIQVNPRLQGYAAKDNHNYFFWIMFLLILCGAGIWGFKMIKDFDFSQLKPDFSKYYEQNTSENSDTNAVVKIQELPIETPTVEENLTEAINITENSNIKTEDNITENSSQILAIEEPANSDQTLQNEANAVARIFPRKNIWVGIKNLNDMSKRSFNSKEPFEVELSGDRLVLTGHGILDVLTGENNESYTTRDALRFHAYDGKFEKIDYDEYVRLNKGKTW